jgi:hypothetical protein
LNQQIIEVVVSPTGETKVETKGFAGAGCRDASKFLETALGLRASEQLTAEYHAQQTCGNTVREGQS